MLGRAGGRTPVPELFPPHHYGLVRACEGGGACACPSLPANRTLGLASLVVIMVGISTQEAVNMLFWGPTAYGIPQCSKQCQIMLQTYPDYSSLFTTQSHRFSTIIISVPIKLYHQSRFYVVLLLPKWT